MSARKQAYREVVRRALPATMTEVHQRTGLGLSTVSRWLAAMHAAGEIHVGSWATPSNGGTSENFARVWHAGPGVDAERPAPRTLAELSRAARQRARKSGAWEDEKARRRGRWWADRQRRDPLVAALFGAPSAVEPFNTRDARMTP